MKSESNRGEQVMAQHNIGRHPSDGEKALTGLFAFDEGQELREHTAPFDALVQVLEGAAKLQSPVSPSSWQQATSS
jgi:quercetin dioxygenase-like cupin family protein